MQPHSNPLKIALVASSLRRAGAEKQFVYLARALGSHEVDARVFYLSEGGFYENVLRQQQVPVSRISYPTRPFKILFKLIAALQSFKPHIVVASQFCDIAHASLAGHFHRALNIGGIRSDGFWEYGAHGWRGRFLLGLPHALVTNSIKTRSNLTSLGLAPGKLFLLPNVIDLNHFDDCQSAPLQISIPENRVVIIAVGRVHPGKRFERFIKALALARQRVPELYGILAGKDDGAMASLRETAHALGLLPDHLLFAGECANVPALLAQANVLLLPSDIEGFPNVLLEAMAGRLPVITTPAGDSPYLVQHGKTGFVVDFENLVGMAQAMIDLARSPALRRNMGEAGRSRVESDYDFGSLRTLALRLFRAIACQQKHLRALEAFRTLEASVKAGSIGHLLPH